MCAEGILIMKDVLTAIKQFVCYLFWPQRTDKNRYDKNR